MWNKSLILNLNYSSVKQLYLRKPKETTTDSNLVCVLMRYFQAFLGINFIFCNGLPSIVGAVWFFGMPALALTSGILKVTKYR